MNWAGLCFESLDQLRRLQGAALDGVGLGPCESAYRVVHSRPGLQLRYYGGNHAGAPVLLIVPAPIKRGYIWDLSPQRSVVRRALEHGYQVYMVEWTEMAGPETPAGLADYAGPMLGACVEAVAQRSGAHKIFLASHSLGGVFAALYSAYRPARVAGLVLIDVPLHFAAEAGAFRRLLGAGGPAKALLSSSARIPGSLLSMISASAAPATFCSQRYVDYLASTVSPELLETHCRVERWTMDELPMPRKLFDDVVEQLYRQNRFMRGEIRIGGARLHPRDITAPLFSVYQPASRLIPPESVMAFHRLAGSADKELVPYFGDTGVALQHVGGLVGKSAHRDIWPRVFAWMDRIHRQQEENAARVPLQMPLH